MKKKDKKPTEVKENKGGRPKVYTIEIFGLICARISEGESLNKITKDESMPNKITFYRWLRENQELCAQYARAREDRADTYADEIVDIADDSSNDTIVDDDGKTTVNHDVIQRSRLRIDARKWIACKLHPKNYGEKKSLELSGEHTILNVSLTKEDLEKAKDNLKKMLSDDNI